MENKQVAVRHRVAAAALISEHRNFEKDWVESGALWSRRKLSPEQDLQVTRLTDLAQAIANVDPRLLEEAPQRDPQAAGDGDDFRRELESLINRMSQEQHSGTPDFILATFLQGCLTAYNGAVRLRDTWRGFKTDL